MKITAIDQQVVDSDVAGKKPTIVQLCLRCLIDKKIWTRRGRGFHRLRQQGRPETFFELGLDYRLGVGDQAARFDLAHVEVEGGFRASGVATAEHRHYVPAPHQPLEFCRQHLLGMTTQIKDVGEINSVATPHQS